MSLPTILHRAAHACLVAALGFVLAAGAAQAQHLDPATGEARPLAPATLPATEQAPSAAREGSSLELLGRLADGETRGLDLVGTTLFRSNGGYLEALDVSDPTAPEVLSRFLVDEAVVMDVSVVGDLAFVAAQRPNVFGNRGSLQIVDISDVSNPVGVGAVPGISFYSVKAVGSTVYGAALGSGLRIYDASDPSAPEALGFVTVSGGSVLNVEVAGSTAYLAAGGAGLRVVDISDPSAPAIVGSYAVESGDFATDVVYADGYAYVSVQPLGLLVLDVSDPAEPAFAGQYIVEEESNFQIRTVTLDGSTAYLGKDDGIIALDVSDPAAITRTGTLNFGRGGSGQTILVDGATAWVGNRYHGVRVVDIADPAAMSETALIPNGGFNFKVTVQGEIAYVVDLIGQLRLIDISDPTAPSELSRLSFPGGAYRVDVVGDVAYLVHQESSSQDGPGGSLTRIDVSDPTAPTVIDVTPLPLPANGVSVIGDVAFLALGQSGTGQGMLSSMSLEAMAPMGAVDAGNTAWDVRVEGDVAYIATFGSGLTTMDVADPAAMSVLSQGEIGGIANSLVLDGTTLYLADLSFADSRGLTIVDVSDPANPQEIGTGDVMAGGNGTDVAYHNDHAYVVVDFVGLYQYDVTDPGATVETANIITSDRATGVDTEGDLVVVTDTGAGIWIFRGPPSVATEDGAAPDAFELGGSYPNPFRESTTVRYRLAEAGAVRVSVHDVLGREVAVLVEGAQSAGWQEAAFSARGLAAGVYFVHVEAGAQRGVQKITLVR